MKKNINMNSEPFSADFSKKGKDIRALQNILDHRTRVENQALALISECKFQEAILLLNELDNSELDLYI